MESNIVKKNIFFVYLSLTLVIVITACNSIGVTDDPYGPTLNCDPDKPIDEIVKCVDDKYAFMDSVYESPRVKADKQYRSWDNQSNYTLIPTNYRKIDEFESIKECYKKDKCQFDSKSGLDSIKLASYDEYNKKKIRIDNKSMNIVGNIYVNQGQFGEGGPQGWFSSFGGKPSKYIRSYKNPYKDIIILKQKKQTYIYVSLIESIKLKKDKILVIANIERFCLSNIRNIPKDFSRKIYESTQFITCGLYRFYYISDDINQNLAVSISSDKRINPQKLYIRIREDTFEIDLID